MKVSVSFVVYNDSFCRKNDSVSLSSSLFNSYSSNIDLQDCYAYPSLINSHDHLIGNWFPRAGDSDLYPNSHIWVKNMRESDSVKERDKIWVNSLPMNFFKGNGKLLAMLGCYKNIFSGVVAIQDHSPLQQKEYYDMFPIKVIRNYRQTHSLPLGNFWGGEEAEKEMELTEGIKPYILHLGEGLDDITANEFSKLKELDLLQHNTLIVHGIALTENDIKECAEKGASICWCPFSNHFLIGKSLDVESCLKYNVNVVLGTDSTLSGSINIFEEMRFAKCVHPGLSTNALLRMVTTNAKKALFLGNNFGRLSEDENNSVLITDVKNDDPYENLLTLGPENIVLSMYKGVPLYGHIDILKHFSINEDDYYFFNKWGDEYFVIGHPEKIMETIDEILGYQKILPYLPFQDS